MGKNNNSVYESLYSAWKKAYGEKRKGDKLQHEMNCFWNLNKKNPDNIQAKLAELAVVARTKPSGVLRFFDLQAEKKSSSNTHIASLELCADPRVETIPSTSDENDASESITIVHVAASNMSVVDAELQELNDEDHDSAILDSRRRAPTQMAHRLKLSQVLKDLKRLELLKNNGMMTKEDLDKLNEKTVERKQIKNQIRRLQSQAAYSQKFRHKQKQKVERFKDKFPLLEDEIQEAMGTRTGSGRPLLEDEQPLLLKTIVDIVCPDACTDSRRRSEMLRTCATLDDLTCELKQRGFKISRMGTYLRLLPKKVNSAHGKKHVRTVPVKLLKAHKTGRKGHVDDHYASALNKMIRELAELMGERTTFVLSQDDKARIALGLPAATKQAPILMHREYKVRLPDHDWIIAPGHKLIPSVYACLGFESGKLSYSGPTKIAIRSAKHDSSTAMSHVYDLRQIFKDEAFQSFAIDTGSGLCKPILIVFSDGGPDENLRFRKVMIEFAKHFIENDLDAVFVATHAPGQSAYNQVERRMAPLSRDLSGLILPHDSFGTHLNDSGQTTDPQLERRNFKEAGDILAEVWSDTIINGHPVIAEYVEPGQSNDSHPLMSWMTPKWISEHVCQSQYCLQIVKCNDEMCCKPWRTNLNQILLRRFLPAPVKFLKTSKGIEVSGSINDGNFGDLCSRLAFDNLNEKIKLFPLDQFCPSVQDKLEAQSCKICYQYFVTKIAFNLHKKEAHVSSIESICATIESVVRQFTEEDAEQLQQFVAEPEPVNDNIVIISNLQEWMASEFIDLDDE